MSYHVLNRLFAPSIIALGKRKTARVFTAPPITICGCARSGTTLLLAILDAHPHIWGMDEVDMFTEWERDPRTGAPRPRRIDRLYRHILFSSIPSATTRYCEKRPGNVRFLNEIIAYLDSQVRVIHLVRDARDVLTSRHPLRPDEYWVDIDRWVTDVRAGLALRQHPCVLTERYEDLVGDFDKTAERIASHIGENCAPLRQWRHATGIRKSKAWFTGVHDVHRRSVGKWRDASHRKRLEQIMADSRVVALLEELGYC
ncbi:MAG: hypothetical protein GF331_18415 [Chitinivibrionales bacterium]|nr:hypothetical protein [Chitinivibrionales bacterium]